MAHDATKSKYEYPRTTNLATDPHARIAWLAEEMGYGRDKTEGFKEKLTRLARDPDDRLSVYGFMSDYWNRFLRAEAVRAELPSRGILVTKALQAHAKVAAGLSDKVALANWMERVAAETEIDFEDITHSALQQVKRGVKIIREGMDTPTDLQVRYYNEVEDFALNPMGEAVLAMHSSFAGDPEDYEELRRSACRGAAYGVVMLDGYAQRLAAKGFDVSLPQPGAVGSGGEVVVWS